MSLKPAISAALLALFAAACQPAAAPVAETPAAPAAEAAPPGEAPAQPTTLTRFQTGKFERIDLDVELPAPTSTFEDADGKLHTFAEFRGKVLVYNIWAEWCGPCVLEMPSLARLQKAFAGKDVAVVPVAYGFGKGVTRETTLAKFRELVGEDLPFFYDGETMLQAEAKTGALPATIIYDKQGQEVARLLVDAHWDSPEAVALVQAILDGER